jgi:hypothetical protein
MPVIGTRRQMLQTLVANGSVAGVPNQIEVAGHAR